ncbi:MAG: hypothetical protein ACLTFB_00650 [Candidatus Phytoplasma pyri]
MYQIQIMNTNLDKCKLSTVQLVLIILISIFTMGIGWFLVYPFFKACAFNRDINLQISIKKYFFQEINNLQNKIQEMQKNINLKEENL